MSLIDKASLVQIPSGYAEDKLYSEVPNTAAGDFTFTRASTGTRVNADGYIEEVPWNKLGYSEDFSQWANWVQGAALTPILTTDAANSPIGTLTADRLQCNQVATGSPNRVGKSFSFTSTQASFGLSQRITLSCWVKSASGSDEDFSLYIRNATLIDATYNLIATNEWQRFELEYETRSYDVSIQVIIGLFQHPTTTTNDIYIWGAQLVKGDLPKTYIKTTNRLDIPRLDYSGGASCASLLLEPQRTNLITYSEDFSQSYWGKLGLGVASAPSVTSNTSISPSGEQNASRVIFDLNGGTSASDRSIIRVSESTSSARVFSIYIKSFDGTDQQISLHIGSELALFTVTSEWKRYTFSISSGVTFIGFGLKGTNGVDVSDVLFYGAQLEQGSYPTSYIPSNSGSQTTRSADVCNNAGTSATFNSTEGVLFAEIAALAENGGNRGIAISDGTSSNRVLIYYTTTTNQITALYTYNGTTQVSINKTFTDSTQFSKCAFKYKENDCAFWIDGVEVGADNTATAFAADTLDTLNFDSGAGGSDFYGKTKQLMVFNEALSDEELADLTGAVHQTFNSLATFYEYTIL